MGGVFPRISRLLPGLYSILLAIYYYMSFTYMKINPIKSSIVAVTLGAACLIVVGASLLTVPFAHADDTSNPTVTADTSDVPDSASADLNSSQDTSDYSGVSADDTAELNSDQADARSAATTMKTLQKKISRLASQGVTVPQNISDDVSKTNSMISAVLAATTLDDANVAGTSDVDSWVQSVKDDVDDLTNWPKSLKQADATLKSLNRALKQDQIISAKLSKSGIDISSMVSDLAANISDLQGIRNDAADLAKTDLSGASSQLDTFTSQVDDATQSDQAIKSLSTIGRFASDLQKTITQDQKVIASLQKRGADVGDLEDALAALKDAGDAVVGELQAKPIDASGVTSALSDYSQVQDDFSSAKSDAADSLSSGQQ